MSTKPIRIREQHIRREVVMKKMIVGVATAALLATAGTILFAQDVAPASKGKYSSVQAKELVWQTPSGVDPSYAAIDAKQLHEFVEQESAIGVKYRDQGHQWWGRLAGYSSGEEEQRWVEQKFKEFNVPSE